MRAINLTLKQSLINKINAKQPFTYKNDLNKQRYIIGIKNLHTSENPSIYYDNIYIDTSEAIEKIKTDKTITFGGWLSDNGLYYVDYGKTTNSLKEALKLAKENKELAIWDNVENKEIIVR